MVIEKPILIHFNEIIRLWTRFDNFVVNIKSLSIASFYLMLNDI